MVNTRDPLLQDGGGAGRKKWLVGREQPVQQAVGGEQQSCQDPEWQKKRQCKTIICTSCHARRIRAPLYACSFVGAASQASYTGCQRREEARQVHHLSPDWLTRLYGARVPVGGEEGRRQTTSKGSVYHTVRVHGAPMGRDNTTSGIGHGVLYMGGPASRMGLDYS